MDQRLHIISSAAYWGSKNDECTKKHCYVGTKLTKCINFMHKLFSKFIGMRGTLPLKCAENTESEMNQKKKLKLRVGKGKN